MDRHGQVGLAMTRLWVAAPLLSHCAEAVCADKAIHETMYDYVLYVPWIATASWPREDTHVGCGLTFESLRGGGIRRQSNPGNG